MNQSDEDVTALISFLHGLGKDTHNRTLTDVWAFDDTQIEQTHDFIQWLFPLAERSLSAPKSPSLNEAAKTALRASAVAKNNILTSREWYEGFLERNRHWVVRYDHNHLRITRVIKSLRLLVDNDCADGFRDAVYDMLGDNFVLIDVKVRAFWNAA